MKDFSLAICGILIFSHLIGSPYAAEFGIYDGCPLANHFFYIFFHAGWLHLLCNCMFILEMGFFAHSLNWKCWFSAISIAWFMPALSNIPVVGFSGVLYALSGYALCFSHRKKRQLAVLAALVLFQYLCGGCAILLHLMCFFTAVIIGLFCLPINDVD